MMSKEEVHAYAIIAGGTNDDIHDPNHVVDRPGHLFFKEKRFANIVGVQNTGMHKLFYEIHGNGPKKILAIMGLAGTHTQFEPQLLHFGLEKSHEYTLCVVDNRGVGLSDTPGGRWRTTDIAADFLQLLMHLEKSSLPGEGSDWGSGVNVMGFSMGGMTALELILMDPKRFGSLNLISTHAGGVLGTLPPLHGLPKFLATFGALGGVGSLDAGLNLLFPESHLEKRLDENAQTYRDEYNPKVPLRNYRTLYGYDMICRARKYVESGHAPEIRLDGIVRQVSAVITHYVSWERLERIKSYNLQVLVVTGELDNLVGYWNGRTLAQTLNGKLLHYKDAGHGVSEQYATQVNRAIDDNIKLAAKNHDAENISQRKPLSPGYHPWSVLALTTLVIRFVLSKRNVPYRNLVSVLAALLLCRKWFGGFMKS